MIFLYHSVTFKKTSSQRNTWDNWKLISAERPVFPPPPLKSKYVDLPGTDGQLDLTDLLGDGPKFGNVTGSFSFILLPDNGQWDTVYSDMLAYLHGQKVQIILEDRPGFYREGRTTINSFNSGPNYSTVAVEYVVSSFDIAI